MLNPVGFLRHAAVGLACLVCPLFAWFGPLGSGRFPERFDAKQVVVTPSGADGVHVREVVDQDFGSQRRHGHLRTIPHDFGIPVDIVASSPDAPDELSVQRFPAATELRIGDPDRTITGQHRYVVDFTLPAARVSAGELALDIIGTDEALPTQRFEVVVSGWELASPACNVGDPGDEGGCELVADGDVYRAVIDGLEPGQGITVGGRIIARRGVVDVPEPPLPDRRGSRRVWAVGGTSLAGAMAAVGTFAVARRRGRNWVAGHGAAEAAGGPRGTDGERLVTDAELGDLATTEFVPPKGLRPWQGNLALREMVVADTVAAWFGEMIGAGALVQDGDPPVLSLGSVDGLDDSHRRRLQRMFTSSTIPLGSYHRGLATAWKDTEREMEGFAGSSGWWKRRRGADGFPAWLTGPATALALVAVIGLFNGWGRSLGVALAAALAAATTAGCVAYWPLLPQRTAAGSAVALQVESFRRFLESSEARHVEWAWQQGLLREYTAWAVALGAAGAWGDALARSAVPPEAVAQATPLTMYGTAGLWNATRTPPAQAGTSSGGSGGFGGGSSGGFSGGSVGGGGGGGSSGSW